MLPSWKIYYLLLHFESVFLWLIMIYLSVCSPWFSRQAVINDVTAGSLKLWYMYVYMENLIYMLEPDQNSDLPCWKVWSMGLFQCCHAASAVFPRKQHKRNAALNQSGTLIHLSQVSQAPGWDCILGHVVIGRQGWSEKGKYMPENAATLWGKASGHYLHRITHFIACPLSAWCLFGKKPPAVYWCSMVVCQWR